MLRVKSNVEKRKLKASRNNNHMLPMQLIHIVYSELMAIIMYCKLFLTTKTFTN